MSKNKMTLYDISSEMDSLFSMLVTDEEDQAEFDERFSKLEIQLSDKMLACHHVVRNWNGFIENLDAEIERLRAVRDVYKGAKSRVMGRVRGILEKLDDRKFIDAQYGLGFRLQKNSQPAIDVQDIEALAHQHPDFVNIEVLTTPDKKAIAKHFKDTGEIPNGTEIEQGHHVRVI